jgi:hypothetical protein
MFGEWNFSGGWISEESSVPREHSGFNFELYGREPASLRVKSKLKKHFFGQSELLNRVV